MSNLRVTTNIVLLFFILSCANWKKEVVVNGVTGGLVGGMAGSLLSPNKESAPYNTALFGGLGAGASATITYYLGKRDQKEKELSPMILGEEKGGEFFNQLKVEEAISEIKPKINLIPKNRYEVPLKKLPKRLKGKVKKQFILEYHNEGQTIQMGNKTIELGPFKAWEFFYEK